MQLLACFLMAAGLSASLVTAQLPSPVQTYFVPLPENDLIALFKEMSAGVSPPASGNVNTVISIAIASNNTIVYYDHWEDGFETDARLKTQPTTLIWGDGNLLNGVAPGTVDDKLKGGTAIVLSNNVPVPRVSTKIFFDGSDRIQSSLPIAVTRFAYPDQPGSLMAGAVEVFNFNSWGRKFIAPVGETTLSSTNAWEIARFYVMAGEDNSEVFKNGIKVGGTFNKGQSINFPVKQGDVITSDRPIQVDLIGADKDDTYELRWYAQVDAGDWTDEYISPVAETLGNTAFWFYNPNISPITIGYNGGNLLTGSFDVPALSSKMIPCTTTSGKDKIQILTGDTMTSGGSTSRFSGVRFKGTGGSYYAFVQVDADDGGQIYDWGFPMIPTSRLTSQALVGLGLGCTTGCLKDNNLGGKKERSVVWVTPIADSYIYVDFDGNGVFDFAQRVTALNSLRITDTKQNDNDMTGAIIASVDAAPVNGQPPVGLPVSIGVAWGQDPIRSFSGDSEALDLGTAVLPLANPDLNKEVVAVINPDGSVDPFKSVDQVGDIISYIIIVSNVGFSDLTGVVVNDPLLTGKLVGPTESKNTDGILARGETFTYRGNYTVTAADISTKGGGDNNIENLATVTTKEYPKPVTVQVETPIFLATIGGNVKEDVDADDTGDVNIPGVLITLLNGSNNVLATTLTDASGNYAFINLTAGTYAVKETNLGGYIDVKDVDGGDPNLIVVANVIGGTDRLGNDFVDERKGSISGFVFENVLNGPPIASVTITLRNSTNGIVATTSTDTAGFYKFSGLIPGLYTVVETNLSNDVADVSDFDSAPDGDPQDGDVVVDNKVFVKLNSNEDDIRNDFVDKLKDGSISGVVTDDKGNKLAGAVIKLIFGGVVVETQTTGPAGTYSFTNRVPGDYIVQETNPSGYPLDISDYDNSGDGDAADSDTTVNNSIGVKLLPGENDTDNNFQDSNNGKISGTVKDDTGNPLVSVLITLKLLNGTTVATTLTGTDGSYLFIELEPDSYNVFEENPPLFPINVSDRDTDPDSVPDPTDSDIAVDNKIGVVLQPGETDKGNDFVDSNKGKITGFVTDHLSNPLIGVLLELKSGTTVIKTTLSGGNGGYAFDSIPPGSYTVVETNPSSHPANISDYDNSPDGDASDSNRDVDNIIGVTLTPGETDSDNDFVDGKTGSISGTVKDDNGAPLPGVTVQLKDSTGAVVRTTATSGSGAYLFPNVFPGTYTLFEINPPGYDTDVSDYDTSNDGDATDSVTTVDSTIGVVVLPGENDDNNDFVDSDNGSISGTVKEDQGKPLVGVKLTLTTSAGVTVATTATDSNGAYIFRNVEPGAYFVVETNPDAYPSNVSDEDSTPDGDSGDSNKAVDNSIPVTLQKSENDTGNDFVDSNNGAISGTVKDDDGQALKNVVIMLKDSTGSIIKTAATNVLGEYSFNELEPGEYTVIEIQPGSHPISISDRDEAGDGDVGDSDTTVDNLIQVTLKASEKDTENNFVDSNKGSISGNVTSADSDLLSVVLITLLDKGSNVVATTLTDSNGKYLFTKVPPGDYSVIETNRDDFPSNVSDKDESNDGDSGDNNDAVDNAIAVTIQPGEADKDNNFVDDNDGAISGTVTDDEGKPLVNVRIELLKASPAGPVIDTVFTNAVGSYTFNNVEPGDYVVKETNPVDYPTNVSDGDASDDGDADDLSTTPDNLIKVTLKPGELDSGNDFVDSNNGSISGTVNDDQGKPLAGVEIQLQTPNGTIVATTTTGSNGAYSFPDEEPGSYVLVEKNPDGYPGDVSDYDTTPDGDPDEGVMNADNKIPVTLKPAEDDTGNNFVDSNNGLISGTVKDDKGNVLPGVQVELLNPGKTVVKATVTDSTGFYVFTEVEPGTYNVKETNPSAYPLNVSDYDASDDGDATDPDRKVDDLIGVTLTPGEEDMDNNFVDSNNGAITGTVKDDNGKPIAGVPIQLQSDGPTPTVIATTTTDSNGAYEFSEVEPGTYKVVETNLAAYPINVYDYDTTNDGDSEDGNKVTDNVVGVTLNPGETDTGNDFVDSDNGKITGTVKNDNGSPLSSVLLTLKDSAGAAVSTTVTNGNGVYVFDNLEPGNYTVVETNPEEYPANLLDQDFTNDSDPTDSDTTVDNIIGVTLQPGETDDGNNFVDSDNASISGSVKDDSQKPLVGVKISLHNSTGVVATTLTDAQGLYEFTGLEPGPYTVTEANPDGYKTDISDGDTSLDGDATDGDLTPDNTISVDLKPSEADANNDFVDSNKGSISGTVVDDKLNPLAGVILTLKKGTTTVTTTATAADGSYKFSGVLPGDYSVIETNPVGYPSNVRDGDTVPDGDVGDADTTPDNSILVTVDASEDDVGNDFVDSNNGSISGSVKDDNGNPIPGVMVALVDNKGITVDTATTNADGGYVFNEVEPGDYTVVETQPAGYPNSVSDYDEDPDGDAGDVDKAVDNKISITLKAGEADKENNFVDSDNGSISGSVFDDNGNSLPGVVISLLDGNLAVVVQTTATDGIGAYKFSEVEPGSYTVVEINPPGFPSDLSDYDNTPDGDDGDSNTDVDNTIPVTLKPGENDDGNNFVDGNNAAISGTVKDDEGKPLVNVKIELLQGSTVIGSTLTNDIGNYTFSDVEPGDYVVKETNPVGYPKNLSDGDRSDDGDADDLSTNPDDLIKVTLKPGELDSDNDFVDSNNGSISGTVKDDLGKPLAGVEIQLQTPNGTVVATTTTGSNGAYSFPDEEPGSYVLVEKNPDGYPGDVSDYDTTPDGDPDEGVVNADNKIPVTLEPAEDDTGNNFVDSNNGLISGNVKDDKGNVLPGVQVELLKPDKTVVKATLTDSNGFYAFTEVEPGTYDIKETNLSTYPLDVSDYDASDDGDTTDPDRTVDNLIGVTLKPGEVDTDNNFVDSNKGAITGTVKDDNGRPIAGVPIELQRIDGATATVVGTTTTDFNGAYEFTEVEPGTYKVVETNLATYPDSVSDYDTTPDSDPQDLSKIVDDIVDVTLNPGETDTGNDFVDSDNGKITGIVTDDKMKPLSSVLLTLKDSTGAVVSTTVTNGNGIYVFDNVEPGNYTVAETNPEIYPANLFDQDFTNDSDPTDSDTTVDNIIGVTLQPGETDDGNNFMDSNLGSISGSVDNDEDEPISGVKITLSDSTGVVATTLTDAQGLYEFTGLEPGPYTVTEANPDGYKTDISDGDTSLDGDATDGDLTPDNTISVDLKPSEADANNDFVDSNKGSISGTVVDDKLNPLAGVILTLKQGTTTVTTTSTAADGSYKFSGVVPGDYSVIETNPVGYPSNVRDGDTVPDGDVGDADTTPDNSILVIVDGSEDDVGNDFVDSNNGSISGSVKDDNGDGIAGVTLTLVDSNGDVVGTATTITDGGYVFNEVEPGDYTVVETQPEGFPDSLSDKDNTPEDSDVFDSDQTVDNKIGVSLSPGESDDGNDFVDSNDGSISGLVKDDNGNPLKTVTIFLYQNNTVIATTKTDSLGFYIFNNVEPGEYDLVEINPVGFPSSLSDYDNSPDGDVGDSDTVVDDTIAVTLLPSEDDTDNNFVDSNRGSISGSVKDEKGTPLVDVTVVLTLPGGTVIDTVTTSPSGGYTFNNVDPGDYVVEETNPVGYPRDVSDGDDLPDGDVDDSEKNPDNQIKVTLTEGENDDGNNFVDSKQGSISGTVEDDEGRPLADVEIQLQKPDGTVVATATSSSDGAYTFPDVEPGSYVLVEKNPDGYPDDVSDYDTTPDGDPDEGVVNADNKIPVTLEPAEDDTGNNFVDSNNGLISGTVKDDKGNVLPGVQVELLNPGKTVVKATVTDSNGFYAFTEVEPGTYDIKETNLSTYPIDVSDYDATDDGDTTDPDRTVDNLIGVTLKPGEEDTDNNFVDSNKGAITGTVKDDKGKPIAGVPIELQHIDGATATVVGTTTTNSNGAYSFDGVEPGTYKVVESNLPAYPDDVSDYDAIPDGDATDLDTTVDNSVGVTLKAGETDAGNNFVDSDNGVISGTVTDDNGAPIPGTPITLKDADGNIILTSVTDSNGKYVFEDLEPGDYTIIESNLPEFPGDLSDYDTLPDGDQPDSNKTTDNVIGVTVKPGEKDLGNNFVDSNNGSVSGSVTDDDGKPLVGVPVQLLKPDGSVTASTTTDSNGDYIFTDVEPGAYSVKETNPVTHPLDVSDYDTSPDGDSTDTDTTVDNIVGVTVSPSEQDKGNDFVDSNKGSITGSVTDEQGEALKDVTLTLTKPDGSTATTLTDSNGEYTFVGLPPGTYTLTETNPPGFSDVSDYDEIPDGDEDDSNTVTDNKIVITITPGEKDGGNNFVDTLDSSAPSASPVTPVPTAPLTGSVSGSVTDDDGKPIKNVPLVLQTPTGEVIASTTTNDLGEYLFTNIPPGTYNIVESELPLYPVDVSDYDTTPDGDATDADTKVDNTIGVTVDAREADNGNNFVDSDKGSITGSVTDELGEPLKNVTLTLTKPDGSTVTTVTDSNGEYTFVGLPPGNYTLTETNPPGFSDVSDYDEIPDGDEDDSNTVPDNKIVITITPGEKDGGNNFVDTLDSSAPSASPVTPSPTAPLTGSVTGSVTDDDGKPIKDVPLVLQTPTGEVIATTTTNDLGEYVFINIPPGDYNIVESELPLYPVDVSDYDTTPDGDEPDADSKVDNIIGVTVKPREVDSGNNFVDSDKGSITGSVTDELGEPLKNVTLTLTKPDGSTVTTVTDSNGEYTFVGLPPGNYTLTETNPPGFSDVSDYDEIPDGDEDDSNNVTDNKIVITITPGEKDGGNNFVDTLDSSAPSASPVTPVPTAPLTGSVSGSVTDDDGKPIKNVPLVLQTPTGEVIATTTTNDLGEYVFINIPPGDYNIVESELPLYPVDVSDYDTTPDGDVPDADSKVDNIIGVTVKPREVDSGNNFVDSDKGSITGSVTDELGEPLKNVTLTLTKPDGSTVTTVTDSNGEYTFVGLPPGNYTLTETNPPGFSDVSDYDENPDGDEDDSNTVPDNKIVVSITPGEKDEGNNFVDRLPIPDTSSPPTSAPIPRGSPSSPPDFCAIVPDPTCKLCAPSRSLDYCNVSESFPTLIQNRTAAVRINPTAAATEGYWFHYLEDKVAAYLLSVEQEVSAPEIFCCVTSASELSNCFLYNVPPNVDGVVIKATNFHSSQGVYVLVPNPAGNGTINLLDNSITTYEEVVAELSFMQATKIIVEEFVGTSLPTEYKFHVVNGEVVAIDIITGRGADCPCYAVVDQNWNRLDQFGCFEPGGMGSVEANGCTAIDFITGRRRAGPVKKDLYICDDDSIPSDLDECLKQEMLTIALEAGARIGVYIRVDMFVVGGKVFVQEYSTNHMNGLRHCAAKFDPLTDCIDSCFIGRAWNAAGAPYGGAPTAVPSVLTAFYALTPQQQCDLLIGVQPPVHFSTCTGGTVPPQPFP